MNFDDMTPLPNFLFISLGPLFPRIRVVGHWGIAGCLNDYLYLLCIQDCCSSEDSISSPFILSGFPYSWAEVWLSNERAEQKSAARALLCRDEECAILCPENKGFHE